MKSIVPSILFSFLVISAYSQTTFLSDDYCLVWSDEFDIDGLPNTANWRYETGYSIRNNEAQNYTANRLENARVENGHLIIEARKDNYQGHEISSASLVSWGKVVRQYGRFECRAKIDIRSGSWPAFWTLGERMEWPNNGEIDIMEYYQGKLLGNAAWGTETRWQGNWDSQTMSVSSLGANWANQFHIFMMEWTPDYIRLYVDNVLINDVDLSKTFNGSLGNYENPFRQPHYLILNQAIGGNNGGSYANTQFPIKYEIDYVRIYQKGNCNLDCNWEENGQAYFDGCSNCIGGSTNKDECVLTCNGNLITNPDFENGGLASWTGWGTRSATNQAYAGNSAVAVGNGAVEQVITVLPNTTYVLQSMTRKAGGGGAFLGVKDHGTLESNIRFDNNTWQKKTLQFTTGNATSVRIYCYNPDGGTAYADNFYLEQKGCELITNTETDLTQVVNLYPNPSNSSFTIVIQGGGIVQLFDSNGRMLTVLEVNSTLTYGDLLSSGVYTIRLITNDSVKSFTWSKF